MFIGELDWFSMSPRFSIGPDYVIQKGRLGVTTHLRICVCICALQWRQNDPDGVSIHQPRDRLLNRLFRRRSKKTSKLCVLGLCTGNYRWIPRTKGQQRGKCFHLMTSLWVSPRSIDENCWQRTQQESTRNYIIIIEWYLNFAMHNRRAMN